MIVEWLNAIWQGFAVLTPSGIQPEYFWSTFILIFALVYALLSKVSLFGQGMDNKGKGINVAIALVFAYFTASSAFATIIISKMAPSLGMLLVAVLSLVMVFAFLSGEGDFSQDKYKWVVGVITIIGFGYILWSAFSGVPGTSNISISTEDWGALIAIGIILGILYYAFKGG